MHSLDRPLRSTAGLSRLLLVAGLTLPLLLGCRTKPGGQAPPPAGITIAYPKNISPSLALIALGKGYFGRGGAAIKSASFETGKDALDAMLAGKAELALVAEMPIARAILGGGQLKILAAIEQSGLDVCVVARKDRGIINPADLRGKAIGFIQGTSAHYFLGAFLLANGIEPGAVRLVDLPPLQLRGALLDGTVDAVCTWDPYSGLLMKALAAKGALFRDEYIYTQTFCLVARPEFVRDHPDQVKVILEGLVSARDLLFQAPVEARTLVAAYSGVDPGMVDEAMPHHDFEVGLEQSLLFSLEDECQWFQQAGVGAGQPIPDLLGYLYLPGLLQVRPEGVQVIHAGVGNRR